MRTPLFTKQFQKDIQRVKKQGKNLEKLKIITRTLIEGKTLDPIHHEHKLIGSFQGRCECHIESNWLLIYKKEPGQIIFERTGSHSDLFRN